MLHWTFLWLFVSKFSIRFLHDTPTSRICRSKIASNFKTLFSNSWNFSFQKGWTMCFYLLYQKCKSVLSSLSLSWHICHHPDLELSSLHSRWDLGQYKKNLSYFLHYIFTLRNSKCFRLLFWNVSGVGTRGDARNGWNHITCKSKSGGRVYRNHERK